MTRAQQTSPPAGAGAANGPLPQARKAKDEKKKTTQPAAPTVNPATPAKAPVAHAPATTTRLANKPGLPAPRPTTTKPHAPLQRAPAPGARAFGHSPSATHGAGPAGRVTAAAFLASPESEVPGFGLYSYILFGSRPLSGSDRWRLYYETIAAFLGMPALYEELRFVPSARVNITLLPVTSPRSQLPSALTPYFQFNQDRLNMCCTVHQEAGELPSHDMNGPYAISDLGAIACVLVDDYDYARAEALLSLFATPHTGGPYIVSARQPLSGTGELPPQYLYQDLSSVPPQLVPLWVTLFMVQARDEEFWRTRTKDEFVLRLRTVIAVVSQQLPDFDAVIRWHLATLTPTVHAAGLEVITRGQTINEVVAIMGQPVTLFDSGQKTIYVYKNLRITFIGGKVVDVQ